MISVLINELDVMGGTQKQVLRFCEYLQAEGEEFELVTKYLNLEKTYPEFSKFNIKKISKSKRKMNNILRVFYDLYLQLKIYSLISKKYTVLNVHDNGFPLVILLAGMFNKKVYWQINDLPGAFLVGNAKDSKRSFLRDAFNTLSRILYKKLIIKVIDQITVNVTKNKERVNLFFDKGAEVLYCGVDIWKGSPPRKLGYRKKIKILSSGVFFPYRNYETQVALIKKMLENGYEVELNIIGSTALNTQYSEKILNLIKQENLSEFIHIHGQVSQKEYIKLHEESDLFVFINIDQSWGLAVFEAMSAGLPVIVSNSVGATEILDNGNNAIFVNPTCVSEIFSNIQKLENPEIYQKVSMSALNYVNNLSWDNTYSKKLLVMIKKDSK